MSAIAGLGDRLGPVEVPEYSPLPAPEFTKPILETTADDVRAPLEFSVLGAVAAAQAVIRPMRESRHLRRHVVRDKSPRAAAIWRK